LAAILEILKWPQLVTGLPIDAIFYSIALAFQGHIRDGIHLMVKLSSSKIQNCGRRLSWVHQDGHNIATVDDVFSLADRNIT